MVSGSKIRVEKKKIHCRNRDFDQKLRKVHRIENWRLEIRLEEEYLEGKSIRASTESSENHQKLNCGSQFLRFLSRFCENCRKTISELNEKLD